MIHSTNVSNDAPTNHSLSESILWRVSLEVGNLLQYPTISKFQTIGVELFLRIFDEQPEQFNYFHFGAKFWAVDANKIILVSERTLPTKAMQHDALFCWLWKRSGNAMHLCLNLIESRI
jgi:hypothetical protein